MDSKNDPARCANPHWQAAFLELLPAIQRHLQFAFRRLPYVERCEAIQEAMAGALVAYRRLVQLDRHNLAYASPLARFAVKHVRAGRRVGGRQNCQDVMSRYCQRRTGVQVQPLVVPGHHAGCWQELVVEDRHSSPAEIAAFRLDFQAWLGSLTPKKRAISESLAGGESAQRVAKLFRVSAARVSQVRRELRRKWDEFQAQTNPSLLTAAG